MILTQEERNRIISKTSYREEVVKRDDRSPLRFELAEELNLLGMKVLWIIAEFAEHEETGR